MTELERFMTHVKVDLAGCWVWMAARDKDGYPLFKRSAPRVMVRGTRFIYEQVVGPIPEGHQIDHRICDNPPCVNPSHLVACTPRENTLRNGSPWAVNSRKTHCKNGHEFTPENTAAMRTKYGTGRQCRECLRAAQRRYRARQAAAYIT